jgi:mRNA interferase MazF
MTVARWSVWLATLDPVVGSEQGKTRPVLVISPDALNRVLPVITALPLTSRKPGRRVYSNEALLPAGAAGLPAESLVLCYQIRALDKRRLQRFFGLLGDPVLQRDVIAALCKQLAIR